MAKRMDDCDGRVSGSCPPLQLGTPRFALDLEEECLEKRRKRLVADLVVEHEERM